MAIIFLGACLALVRAVLAEPARGAGHSPDLEFEAFQIIVTRNIFDPARSANRSDAMHSPDSAEVRADSAPIGAESISLLGVLVDATGAIVFLGGDIDGHDSVIALGDSFAGCRIVDARTSGVRLEQNGRLFSVPVGGTLWRETGGEWRIASHAFPYPGGSASTDSIRQGPISPGEDHVVEDSRGDGGPDNDVLSRMRERRKSELEQ